MDQKFKRGDRVRFTERALAVKNWADRKTRLRQRTMTVSEYPFGSPDCLMTNGQLWGDGWLELADANAEVLGEDR